jgi:hypothetical protein
MAYLTPDEFAVYVGSEIAADDLFLARCVNAAEDAVNDHCARSFDVPAVTSITRNYVPTPCDPLVVIQDIVDNTNLVVTDDGTAVTDFQLEPVNNVSWSGLTQPYYQIRRTDGASWVVDYGRATVAVTSTRWGWPAVPPQVKEATAILAKDLAHLRQNRFGVAGFGEFGVVRVRDNPHVSMLLSKLRHPQAFGVG